LTDDDVIKVLVGSEAEGASPQPSSQPGGEPKPQPQVKSKSPARQKVEEWVDKLTFEEFLELVDYVDKKREEYARRLGLSRGGCGARSPAMRMPEAFKTTLERSRDYAYRELFGVSPEEDDLGDLVAQQVAAEFGGGGGGEDGGGGDFAKQLAGGMLGAIAGAVLKHPKVREALKRWLAKEED
jgi:hypothetical protein